jgi:ribonuclease Z
MGLYDWDDWPDFFPVVFFRLPASEFTPVLDCPDFTITASPVHHLIPTIGLRIEFRKSGKVLAFSCDTEPCDEVVRLSEGADVLIHEATGDSMGHSSAGQAGRIAAKAEVGELYLIHYATGNFSSGDLVKAAGVSFQGKVSLAKDFMTLDFGKIKPLSRPGRGENDLGVGPLSGDLQEP